MKYKLPNKPCAQLFTVVQQMINCMLNSIHSTVTPSIIFKVTKSDPNNQNWLHLAHMPRVDKYQSHTDNDILLYLTDETTSNMTA